MNEGNQITYVKIVPEPPKPSIMEIYVYDPLEYIVWNFARLSFILLALATLSDILSF